MERPGSRSELRTGDEGFGWGGGKEGVSIPLYCKARQNFLFFFDFFLFSFSKNIFPRAPGA